MLDDASTSKKKRRRIPWACSQCRVKKVKCEHGDEVRCARCLEHDLDCSGKKDHKNEGVDIEKLERKLQRMESMLNEMGARGHSTPTSTSSLAPTPQSLGTRGASHDQALKASREEKPLQLRVPDSYAGKSSCLVFFHEVLDVGQSIPRSRQTFAFPFSEDIWQALPWEHDYFIDAPVQFSFPEPDLLDTLVELYFKHVSIFGAVLHRPSFSAHVESELYLTNHSFAEVVLLVAALGARYCNDPRVLVDQNDRNWQSSGWKWFSQVLPLPSAPMRTRSLLDLQKICLVTSFAFSCSAPQMIWTLAGIGLRFAQERGVHRRKLPGHVWTLEDELWKRAFWVLLLTDRMAAAALGSPMSIAEEGFDVELPVAYDQEYWVPENVDQSFRQPDGCPSRETFFILCVHLGELVAFIQRTVYATSKFKAFLAKSNPRWKEDIIRKIDTALAGWYESIPDYLRWPPSQVGTTFYYQSIALNLNYHYARIQAHRPFIPTFTGYSTFSSMCLAVCANAARSCGHIFAAVVKKPEHLVDPYGVGVAFTSAIFLLIHVWEAEKYGFPVDSALEVQSARHCVEYLRILGKRYFPAFQCVTWLEVLVSQEEKPNRATSPHQQGLFKPAAHYDIDSVAGHSSTLSPHHSNPPSQTIGTNPPLLANGSIAINEHEESWWQNDFTMLHNLATRDDFYRAVLPPFGDPMSNTFDPPSTADAPSATDI